MNAGAIKYLTKVAGAIAAVTIPYIVNYLNGKVDENKDII